jgi:hypothetical protein
MTNQTCNRFAGITTRAKQQSTTSAGESVFEGVCRSISSRVFDPVTSGSRYSRRRKFRYHNGTVHAEKLTDKG